MKKILFGTCCVISFTVGLGTASSFAADNITKWNFNGEIGTTAPSFGSGLASLVGGVTGSFASGNVNGGSSDPDTSSLNFGWNSANYAAQGTGNGKRGSQYAVSTIGFGAISVSWDERHADTASKFAQFQYSLDGTNFTSVGLAGNGIFSAALGGSAWYNGRTVDLAGIAGASNNANFAFRIVAIFDPSLGNAYSASTSSMAYSSTGALRFDMIKVKGTALVPAPGALALLALGGFGRSRRRRA